MRGGFVHEEDDQVDMAIFLQEIFCDDSRDVRCYMHATDRS